MKIALFTDSFLPGIGGTENVVLRLGEELSKNHEVMVFAPDYHREFADDKLPFKVVRSKSIGVSKSDFWALPALSKNVKQAINEFKPDIVHSHTQGMLADFANKYAKKNNIPSVTTAHTKFSYCYKHALKLPFLVKPVMLRIGRRVKDADRVTAVSASMKEEIALYGVKDKEITVIRNGSDCKIREKVDKARNDRFALLYVGYIINYKNLKFSLDCLKELKERRRDFVFNMIGRGPSEKSIKRYIKKLGLTDNVIMNGAVTDRAVLDEIYAKSDLFLFTSIFDSDGLVTTEAAGMETPSLVLEGTGASEKFTDGVTGFMAKNSVKGVADKIEELMGNPEKLTSVGKTAKKIIIPWTEITKQYEKIYIEEIEKKKK
ncbi:MAG: glycosyltransferase [Clostridia bacterium]|nr:glycosyltransferase [Clostridia bacterium]